MAFSVARLFGARVAGSSARTVVARFSTGGISVTDPPKKDEFDYDLAVLGSGPAAQKCAINAAKKGKRVCVIDASANIGGVCVHTGTIPSKTFREAVLHMTGYRNQTFYGRSSGLNRQFTTADILRHVSAVVQRERDIVAEQLDRNNIKVISGHGSFEGPHTLSVTSTNPGDKEESKLITADKVLIATGTRPARPGHIPFHERQVFDSDEVLRPDWVIPRTLIVVGAGVIGIEYASMMNIIPGSRVYIIDQRPSSILPFADTEVVESLCHLMRQEGARFLMGEVIKSVVCNSRHGRDTVSVVLESGKEIHADALLYAVGRQANTDKLQLAKIGVTPDKRGLIAVNENFQTVAPHVYAAGDCIGFPALASCSMEQGRLVAEHMFGGNTCNRLEFFPYGIYTIPEISMVGKNERELTAEGIPYEVGTARYSELAKGQMLGGAFGFLKLLFCPKTLEVLGCHAIGEGAIEIIHIGQTVMALGGTLDYFIDTVFNYPALAEAYRVAALNGLGKVIRGGAKIIYHPDRMRRTLQPGATIVPPEPFAGAEPSK